MTHPRTINGCQDATKMMTHHQMINGRQDVAAAAAAAASFTKHEMILFIFYLDIIFTLFIYYLDIL